MANSLPDDFWEKERGRLLAILAPAITGAAQAGVSGAAQMGLVFNPNLSNHDASEWAAAYTDDLLGALETTNRRVVGEALQSWIETPGATVGDLEKQLAPAFGPTRANLIAVTETTRAYSQGNQIAFQEAGIEYWRWNTTRDDLVCPVCSPLHRKVVAIGEPFTVVKGKAIMAPPAHPGCRCAISPVVNPRDKLQPQTEVTQTLPIGGKLREARTERIGPTRLTLPTDLDIGKQSTSRADAVRMIQATQMRLPEHQRGAVREVRLADVTNPQSASWEQIYGLAGYILASTNSGRAITLWANAAPSQDVGASFQHEVGHALALANWKTPGPKDEEAWMEAILADGWVEPDLHNQRQAEDFAWAVQRWLENPQEARNLSPQRTRLIEHWLGSSGR